MFHVKKSCIHSIIWTFERKASPTNVNPAPEFIPPLSSPTASLRYLTLFILSLDPILKGLSVSCPTSPPILPFFPLSLSFISLLASSLVTSAAFALAIRESRLLFCLAALAAEALASFLDTIVYVCYFLWTSIYKPH